jgi:hypothetical protein
LPLIAGAAQLVLGDPVGLYTMVPGYIFSFIAGVGGAWVLLVEILR